MLKFHEIPDTNIVEFTLQGKISSEDIQQAIPQLIAAANKHQKLRILKEVRDIEPLDNANLGQQMGEMLGHLGDITHIAVVADKEWEPAVTKMATVYPFEVQFFDLQQIEKARAWLRVAM
jgi:hypothetical protein